MKYKVGFTLSEVLITLGIIGVVAAMTIPVLMTNIQKKELQAGLKKAYSTLSQALIMYENDNGLPVTSFTPEHQLKSILIKYIYMAKDCGYGTGDADKACMPNKTYVSDPDNYKDIYKTFNGQSNISYQFFDDGQFVMNDNMFVMIENSYQPEVASTDRLLISVDVNGLNKRPNRLGQDLFMFQIDDKGKLLPMGVDGSWLVGYCSKTSTDSMNGAGCTAKALSDENFFKNMPK